MTQAVTTNNKTDKKNAPPAGLDANNVQNHLGRDQDGFLTVELDRPMFKAEVFLTKKAGESFETYEGPICQGYVLGSVAMPEAEDQETGELRPWNCYVIELTVPTKATDRGNIVDRAVGDMVLVAETAQLRQALDAKAVNHPSLMAHVKIIPVSRAPMPDDAKRKMWKTIVRVHPTLVPRKQSSSGNGILAGLLASANTAQLAG